MGKRYGTEELRVVHAIAREAIKVRADAHRQNSTWTRSHAKNCANLL